MRNNKLRYLDGMRGLMALNVIICHFVMVYYPQMYFSGTAAQTGGFLSLFANTPLNVLVNGDIAVRFFLVLTGFLVGRSIFLNPALDNNAMLKKCGHRYVRLLPMVVIATGMTFLTMILGLQNHLAIAENVANPALMKTYCNFQPTVINLVSNMFVMPFLRESAYISPFWMLRYEFWGYMLVTAFAYFMKDSKYRRIGYLVVMLFVFLEIGADYLSCFFGLFVADLIYKTEKETTVFSKWYTSVTKAGLFKIAAGLLGICFATCPMEFIGVHKILGHIPLVSTDMFRGLGVALLLYSTFDNHWLKLILSNKVFLWMGDISYGVFALHLPLMLSAEAYLFGVLYAHFSYDVAAVGAFLLTLPLIYLAAWGTQKIVDKHYPSKIWNWFKRKNCVPS